MNSMKFLERSEELQLEALAAFRDKALLDKAASAILVEKAKDEQRMFQDCRDENKRQLENMKHWQRPSQQRPVEVSFDNDTGKWTATHYGVVASGDTPEMACDNFDHLWVYGDNK